MLLLATALLAACAPTTAATHATMSANALAPAGNAEPSLQKQAINLLPGIAGGSARVLGEYAPARVGARAAADLEQGPAAGRCAAALRGRLRAAPPAPQAPAGRLRSFRRDASERRR